MKTYNTYFNDAWKGLREVHPTVHLPNGYSLNLQQRHGEIKFKSGTREWSNWMHDLLGVLTTGQREKFIHIHVDGKGRLAYLYVPFEVEKLKAGEHLK